MLVAVLTAALLGLIWAAAAGWGLRCLWRGMFGVAVDQHPICRVCEYDLFGSDWSEERCPECGTPLLSVTDIRHGTRERNAKLATLGLSVAAACAALALLPFAGSHPLLNGSTTVAARTTAPATTTAGQKAGQAPAPGRGAVTANGWSARRIPPAARSSSAAALVAANAPPPRPGAAARRAADEIVGGEQPTLELTFTNLLPSPSGLFPFEDPTTVSEHELSGPPNHLLMDPIFDSVHAAMVGDLLDADGD